MSRLLTAITAVSVLHAVGPVLAADVSPSPAMPAKGVPYVAPLYDWTGFYLGAHGGGGWTSSTVTDPTGAVFAPPSTGVDVSGQGWLGGAQIGYNYQLGAWVFGVEGDLSYTDIRGTTTSPFGVDVNTRLNWVGTVTGRLGIAWDRTLVYAKAGAAFGEISVSPRVPPVIDFKGKDTRTGWTVGAGVEYALWGDWSVKAEYNYLDLGTRTVTATSPAGGSVLTDAKVTEHMIKLGANYKFGWR
ncbi:MAG: outer membrane beta-barrel protein [Rhizobiales bacterium]|nr:outer membrane beta-barrel protein [Hyphomicrobiales bacterium]